MDQQNDLNKKKEKYFNKKPVEKWGLGTEWHQGGDESDKVALVKDKKLVNNFLTI